MKSLLPHFIFLLLCTLSLAYIEKLRKEARVYVQEKSIAQGVSIKVFGESGEEWRIHGRELVSFGRELSLLDVELRSTSGYVVRASAITFLRDRNRGVLKGGVEIRGEAFFFKTDRATIDFNRDLLYGKGKVQVWKGRNFIEGKGFKAFLRPLKVIIGKVRTKHEV